MYIPVPAAGGAPFLAGPPLPATPPLPAGAPLAAAPPRPAAGFAGALAGVDFAGAAFATTGFFGGIPTIASCAVDYQSGRLSVVYMSAIFNTLVSHLTSRHLYHAIG